MKLFSRSCRESGGSRERTKEADEETTKTTKKMETTTTTATTRTRTTATSKDATVAGYKDRSGKIIWLVGGKIIACLLQASAEYKNKATWGRYLDENVRRQTERGKRGVASHWLIKEEEQEFQLKSGN